MPAVQDLLRSLLQKDPSNRLSLEEIPTHPWVTRGGALPVLQTSNERAIQRVFEAMRKRNGGAVGRTAKSQRGPRTGHPPRGHRLYC